MPFDYYQLQAFSFVIREGSFQRAAEALRITQSAVSQRIKTLENNAGQPLLIRSSPPMATKAGNKYLSVFLKMDELLKSLAPIEANEKGKLAIGCNFESFDLWFNRLIIDFSKQKNVLFDIILEDQDQTFELLKNGKVFGCVSSYEKTMQGGVSFPLEPMSYSCVASKDFITKYDLLKKPQENILKAPTVIFGAHDRIHEKFLCKLLKVKKSPRYEFHSIPSMNGVIDQIKHSAAFSVVPIEYIENEIHSGKLIDIFPKLQLKIPLYWHVLQMEIPHLKKFTEQVLQARQLY